MTKADDQATAANARPEKNQIEYLYEKMSTLAPQTQMFMQDCSPELDAKYRRIQAPAS